MEELVPIDAEGRGMSLAGDDDELLVRVRQQL
jgi:hypothetical protein